MSWDTESPPKKWIHSKHVDEPYQDHGTFVAMSLLYLHLRLQSLEFMVISQDSQVIQTILNKLQLYGSELSGSDLFLKQKTSSRYYPMGPSSLWIK